jgi:arylsulfatase
VRVGLNSFWWGIGVPVGGAVWARNQQKMLAALLAISAAPTPAEADAAGSGKMNLLFSMADQMRWDSLSSVNPRLSTPNLDRMAAEGVRFSTAYTSTPSCTPARAALLTGRSPWGHGMLGYGVVAKRYPHEYPRELAAAGFETHTIGKDHYGFDSTRPASGTGEASSSDGGREFAHGFAMWNLYEGTTKNGHADEYDEWFKAQPKPNMSMEAEGCWPTLDMNSWPGAAYACNESWHPTAYVGRKAVAFLESHVGAGRGEKPPFLLKISFHRPHSPYDPPQRLLDQTRPEDMGTPVVSADGWSDHFRDCDGDPAARASLDAWCGAQPAAAELLSRRAYHASIAFVDEQVGHIYGALQRTGLLRTTLWLWTADHGDAQGDHYHWRKAFPYEFAARIPMQLRWPEDVWPARLPAALPARGSTIEALVELRDIAPTLLHAAGAMPLNATHVMEGTSLLCLAGGCSGPASGGPGCTECPRAAWRAVLDLEHNVCYNVSNHWSAIVSSSPPMKYVFLAPTGEEQLFDLKVDPRETRNVAADPKHTDALVRLRAAMVGQFEREGRGPAWVKDGKLMPRPASQSYGPNYPGGPPKSDEPILEPA